MTNIESIGRLERLSASGAFDNALTAINKGSPILDELGVTADAVRDALQQQPSQLEAQSGMQPTQLEAIVQAVGRPPLLVKNNKVEGKLTLGGDFAADIAGKISAVEPFLGSVGRIEFMNHDMAWGGTGWVIADDGGTDFLIVTNRHVAKLVAKRTFRGDGVYMFSPFSSARFGAQIDFGEEAGSLPDPTRVLKVEKFTYLADDAAADVAIARVTRPADGLQIGPLLLADNDGDDAETVAVIGYPAKDSRNKLFEMERYFEGLYNVKRFAPGFLRVQGGIGVLGHDCTTLGGNSGSPVLSLESGKVVGLHFAGTFGIGNSAVRVSTLKALLDKTVDAPVVPTGTSTHTSDGAHDADHFEGRSGYDADFLRPINVPLPTIPAALNLSRPSDATDTRPHELRYQHFGILYSEAQKSPVIAALNIDGAQTRIIKRSNSRWFKDLRIDAGTQLGQIEYGSPDIDRGHMVRRAATNWGADDAIAKQSNLDSYHYTVASPQHKGLNRNTQTWLGLENYIMENTRTFGFKTTVFTGPIFGDDDPQLGATGAVVPMDYFKVVAMLAEDDAETLRLHATAYVLSQGQLIRQLLEDLGQVEAVEGFHFGEFRTFQVRISDLEAITGYDFGPLRAADPLNTAVEAGQSVVPLNSLEAIVL